MNTSQGQGSSGSNAQERLNKINVSIPTQIIRGFGSSYSSFNIPIMKIDIDGEANPLNKDKTELTTEENIERFTKNASKKWL